MGFREKYKPYSDITFQEIGIDWFELEKVIGENGNGPGIYPDVGALIYFLVKKPEVSSVIEIGSGCSTVFFTASCNKLNKTFVSLEEEQQYADITNNVLSAVGLGPKTQLINSGIMSKEFDLIFYDNSGKKRVSFLKENISLFEKAKIVAIDDMEKPHLATPIIKALADIGKTNLFLFNPVSRQDRVVYLASDDIKQDFNNWVWDWRPDKIFW